MQGRHRLVVQVPPDMGLLVLTVVDHLAGVRNAECIQQGLGSGYGVFSPFTRRCCLLRRSIPSLVLMM